MERSPDETSTRLAPYVVITVLQTMSPRRTPHPCDCFEAPGVKNTEVLNRNGEDEHTYLVFELSRGKCCQMPFISLPKQHYGFSQSAYMVNQGG